MSSNSKNLFRVHAVRVASFLLFLPSATPLTSLAVEPPLSDRGFYQEKFRKITTAIEPWIDLKTLELNNQSREISDLRTWLIENTKGMATWPPRYNGESQAIRLIEIWQERKLAVEKLGTKLLDTPELGALGVTFWLYGHNLDEPGAAEQAYGLLDQLQKKHPSSPLPPMLQGMMLSRTGGENVLSSLENARTKTTNGALLGLIDLTLSKQCQKTGQTHQSVLALINAIDECPDCVKQFSDVPKLMRTSLSGSTKVKMDNPYYLERAGSDIVAGSRFFGFKARLPGQWSPDGHIPFDPEKRPASLFMLKAPPQEETPLIHGIVFFSSVVQDSQDIAAGQFMKTFGNPAQGVSVTSIKPLVRNQYLTNWYRIDTPRRVGDSDTITMIVALGEIRPAAWTLSDHSRLAKTEGRCESPPNRPKSGFLHFPMRIGAPVEFAIGYNASKGTYRLAEQKMKAILSTLEIENHTSSEIVERRLAALLNE